MSKIRKDFLWGGALSANQSEGAYDEDGKSLTIADIYYFDPNQDQTKLNNLDVTRQNIKEAKEARDDMLYPKRRGIDFYHTYKEDIALLAEMGFKAFRYSICWSRIYPDVNSNEPNVKGLEFYDAVINEAISHGMKPIITILHSDLPVQLIEEYGGWYSEKTIDLYCKYAKTLFEHFNGRVEYWIPFNEINVDRTNPSRKLGVLEEDFEYYKEASYIAMHNEFVASAKVTEIAHKINPNNKIGAMDAYFPMYPLTCNPDDVMKTFYDDQIRNLFFYDVLVKGGYPYYAEKFFENEGIHFDYMKDQELLKNNTADFIAMSYYNSAVVCVDENKLEITGGNVANAYRNPYLPVNSWGWVIDPVGFRYSLNHVYQIYGKPIFVLENGSGFVEELGEDGKIHDDYRINNYRLHIEQLIKAIDDGVDIIGYTVWAPIDVVAGSTGQMKKRYGMIYVDQDDFGNGTKKRIKKDSFWWYKRVIETNGEDLG